MGYGIPDFAAAYALLGGTSVVDPISDQLKNVFPVPFSSNILIEFLSDTSNEIFIEMTDMVGRTVVKTSSGLIHHSLNTININNLNGFSSGVYVLKIQTQSNTYKRLIVKN